MNISDFTACFSQYGITTDSLKVAKASLNLIPESDHGVDINSKLKKVFSKRRGTAQHLLSRIESNSKYQTPELQASKINRWMKKHVDNDWKIPETLHSKNPARIQCRDDKKVNYFFSHIINSFVQLPGDQVADKRICPNLEFVVVSHVLPTLPPFLQSLNKIGTIAAVIPKSSYKDRDTMHSIKSIYDIKAVDKAALSDGLWLEAILKDMAERGKKCIIVDIGGYFAPGLKRALSSEECKTTLIGIVEDTENGHQKYEKLISKDGLPIPLMSVARIELKKTEDFNVGKSIVRAADTILREEVNTILERIGTVGVIGFGKIGSSIASHLRDMGLKVIVYDHDPIASFKAMSVGFISAAKKETILKDSEMIFCATGNESLGPKDYPMMKDGVYIASCTSADDELNLNRLIRKKK